MAESSLPATPSPREFRWYEALSLCLSMISVQLCSEVMAAWGYVFYSPPVGSGRIIYVAIALVGWIFIAGAGFDAITDPLIGMWSDNTGTKASWRRIVPLAGRRRPFIFWGAILVTFTFIAFWHPPIPGQSVLNLMYGIMIICLHVLFTTIVIVPLNSLAPEIARSKQARVRLGQWIAVGMILGLAIANIAPPLLIVRLDPERAQIRAANAAAVQQAGQSPASAENGKKASEVIYSPRGYQRTTVLLAFVTLSLFLLPVICVRERYESAATKRAPPFRELREVLRNKVFLRYMAAFFLFMTGYLAAYRALAHWAIVGLGGSEDTVAFLMMPFIFSALFTAFVITPILSRFMPLKWLWFTSFAIVVTGLPFMYPIAKSEIAHPLLPSLLFGKVAALFGATSPAMANRVLFGMGLFLYVGIGQGIQYVVQTALIGEIIDLDEQQSGERREAIYNGLIGIAIKAGQMLSVGVAAASMSRFGNSVDNPLGIYLVGPIGALIGLLGVLVIWSYPILHVTPEDTAQWITSRTDTSAGPQ